VLPEGVLERVEADLARSDDGKAGDLGAAFERFEATQPALSDYVATALGKPLDETALALGHFLTVGVWLAFDRTFGARLSAVTEDALTATLSAVALEEELRAEHGEEPLDLDDVMTLEQPRVLAFVNEHVEAALEVGASDGFDHGEGGESADVDDVAAVYRTIIVMTLCLSHAVVAADAGAKVRELLA
jgi:hypothetical protein